jgi:predicted nucleotidyltransferase
MTTASTDTPNIRERLARLRPAVLEVAQRYGASNLRVFGSVALNQEHQDSDLDLLVNLPANQSLLALVGIAQEPERLLGCPVDVAEPDSLHPLIRAEVLQHAICL